MRYSENYFRKKQNLDPLYTGAIGTPRSNTSTEILLAADRRVRRRDRAPPYRQRKVRSSCQGKRARTRQIRSKLRSISSSLHARQTLWTKTRTRSTRLVNTLSLTTTRSMLWIWKARSRRTSSSSKRSVASLSVSTRSPRSVHQESHPQQGQSRH